MQKTEKHCKNQCFCYHKTTNISPCLPYCFLQCFLKASVTTYQKQEVLAEKWDPPSPGKPVTFYECHPEDHAPAPSVRADFFNSKLLSVRAYGCDGYNHGKNARCRILILAYGCFPRNLNAFKV